MFGVCCCTSICAIGEVSIDGKLVCELKLMKDGEEQFKSSCKKKKKNKFY
jgi:hypothetical protein